MADKPDSDEGGDFDEQVCTFDFSMDDDVINLPAAPPRNRTQNKRPPVILRDYEGEDFSKYLEDEPPPVSPQNIYLDPVGTKRDKRKSSMPNMEYDQPYPPEYLLGEMMEDQRRPRDAIKDRVSKWLNTVRRPPSRAPEVWDGPYPPSRMANFSYADSKIGLSEEKSKYLDGPGSDSGIDTRSTAYNSDMGYQGNQSMGGWSDSAASHFKKRDSGFCPPPPAPSGGVRRKAKSSSNINAESEAGTVRQRHRSASRSGRDDAASSISGISAASSSKSKKLSTVWKKFSNTISRGRKMSKTSNNQDGAMSYNDEYEDLRL